LTDTDSYRTIDAEAQAKFVEKMSRFLAFAHPVESADEAKAVAELYQQQYHDARHVCYAYAIGLNRAETYSTDNGEPSGTAGKPIAGQIASFDLTNLIIVVVRYFGGIKLGTPGLIAAYREAARMVLSEAAIVERHRQGRISFTFPYQSMNAVMTIAKMPEVSIVEREFDNTCSMTLQMRQGLIDEISGRLLAIDGVTNLHPHP
jgi:uncharacterized YigZ family protein